MISICILNWNTREHLREALRSVFANLPSGLETEVLVEDNASADGSAEMVRQEFPQVALQEDEANLGYAAGSNRLIARALGEFVLLMNPDVRLQQGTVEALLRALGEHEDAAAPRLLFPEGRLQHSVRTFPTPAVLLWEATGLARLFPRSRVFGAYRMTWWDYNDEREVEQPMASLLLVRRRAWEQIGGFDEGFPLYFNDVDFCYRLREAGWKIVFVPQAQAVHYLGASTRQQRLQSLRESHRSLARFYAKHYRKRYGPLVYGFAQALIWLSGWVRWVAAWATRRMAGSGREAA